MKINFISKYQLLIKWVITFSILIYGGFLLIQRQELLRTIGVDFKLALSDHPFIILICVLLMPLNWGIEAVKWRLLIKRIEVVSLKEAFFGVLSGLSFGFITPRSLGDYVGRMVLLQNRKRGRVVGALIISRLSQLLMTLLLGGIGLLIYLKKGYFQIIELADINVFFASILLTVLVCLFVFRHTWMTWVKGIGVFRQFFRLIEIIGEYEKITITKTLLWSFMRYVVFTTQFFLLFYIFGMHEVEDLLWGITLIFLAKSAFVSFNFLTDLGVRSAVSIAFLSPLGVPVDVILAAGLSIWLLNILTPTIIGAFLLLRAKLVVAE